MNLLALDFINTSWCITHSPYMDTLKEPERLTAFLKKRDLLPDSAADAGAVESLLRLRDFLTDALLQVIETQALSEAAQKELNRYFSLSSLVRVLDKTENEPSVSLQPLTKDWNWVQSEISASFAHLAIQEKERLRVCENPECRWYFHDETRNRNKRCCDETCASLVKVRRYRARQKKEQK